MYWNNKQNVYWLVFLFNTCVVQSLQYKFVVALKKDISISVWLSQCTTIFGFKLIDCVFKNEKQNFILDKSFLFYHAMAFAKTSLFCDSN